MQSDELSIYKTISILKDFRFPFRICNLHIPPSRNAESHRERNDSKSREILDRAASGSNPIFPYHLSLATICATHRGTSKSPKIDTVGPINSEKFIFSIPVVYIPTNSRADNQREINHVDHIKFAE